MNKKYYGNYLYYAFYQKIFNTTKIVIKVKIDNKTRYGGISEINEIGNLSEKEIDCLAIRKIKEIESYV